jgi:hypothetical protein
MIAKGPALLAPLCHSLDVDQQVTFQDRVPMAEIEWRPLPPLWPGPAEFADVGEYMLLVFRQDSVPTWEVHRRSKADNNELNLIVSGTADTFEATKAAARFEASAWRILGPNSRP